ncbi:MAG TPA: hypothetical protein VHF86_05895 [Xanthomonadaceae bacterium]|nr:hypothetical protein [Xanthomonadaceae bacterium]
MQLGGSALGRIAVLAQALCSVLALIARAFHQLAALTLLAGALLTFAQLAGAALLRQACGFGAALLSDGLVAIALGRLPCVLRAALGRAFAVHELLAATLLGAPLCIALPFASFAQLLLALGLFVTKFGPLNFGALPGLHLAALHRFPLRLGCGLAPLGAGALQRLGLALLAGDAELFGTLTGLTGAVVLRALGQLATGLALVAVLTGIVARERRHGADAKQRPEQGARSTLDREFHRGSLAGYVCREVRGPTA